MQDAAAIEGIESRYAALALLMDERMRRQWAAAEARSYGWGGRRAVSQATGMKPLPGPWIPPQKLLRRKLQVRLQEVTKIFDSEDPAPLIAQFHEPNLAPPNQIIKLSFFYSQEGCGVSCIQRVGSDRSIHSFLQKVTHLSEPLLVTVVEVRRLGWQRSSHRAEVREIQRPSDVLQCDAPSYGGPRTGVLQGGNDLLDSCFLLGSGHSVGDIDKLAMVWRVCWHLFYRRCTATIIFPV